MHLRLTRRRLLQLTAAGAAASGLPWLPGCGDASGTAPHFFDPAQRETVAALLSAIAPEDETVGALGCDAVEYVDRALAAFETSPPLL